MPVKPTTNFGRDAQMKGVPLNQVMDGARQGICSCLVELQYRIPDCYSPAILDTYLSYLGEPEAGMDPDSHQRSRAYICLLALMQAAGALKHRPSLCLQAAKKLLPALGGIMAWIYLALHLKRNEWCEGSQYIFSDFAMHENIAFLLVNITRIHETVEAAVTAHPLVIDLAVVSWVAATSHGHALVYPSGHNMMGAGTRDGPEEPTITLFHLISTKNAPALAEAILSWRICSPCLFFWRGSQRMWSLVKTNILPGLDYVSDTPVEDINFARTVVSVKALLDANPDLVPPLLESRTPAHFMDALFRAGERAHLIECRAGNIDYMENLLVLAGHVASWAELQPSSFIPVAKSVISGGVVRLLDIGLKLPGDRPAESWKPWRTLLQRIVKWAYSSPGLFKLIWAVIHEHLVPWLSKLDEGSAIRLIFTADMGPLHILSHHFGKPDGLKPCDNAEHTAIHTQIPGTGRGGICSGCRSVAYDCVTCQKRDWEIFHRYECWYMRLDHLNSGGPNTPRYTYRCRAFQTNLIRFLYTGYVQALLEQAVPEPLDGKHVAIVNPGLHESVSFVSVPEYVEVTKGLVPRHLAMRFMHLIETYTNARCPSGPFTEHLTLVHGIIRYTPDTADFILMFGTLPDDPLAEFEVRTSLEYRICERSRLMEAMQVLAPKVLEREAQADEPLPRRSCSVYDCRVSTEREMVDNSPVLKHIV